MFGTNGSEQRVELPRSRLRLVAALGDTRVPTDIDDPNVVEMLGDVGQLARRSAPNW